MSRYLSVGLKHPYVQTFISLKSNKKPNPKKLLTLEGYWEVKTALDFGYQFEIFYVCLELLHSPELNLLFQKMQDMQIKIIEVSAKVFKRMSDRDRPDGVAVLTPLKLLNIDDLKQKTYKKIVVLDGLEIPGNVGTILRSAEGAGVDLIVFTNRKVRLTHPKLMSASLGACLLVPMLDISNESFQQFLIDESYHVFLADAKDQHVFNKKSFDPSKKNCLVLGSEKYGFQKSWYNIDHKIVKIPMAGKMDSLNVACAATVLFYQFFQD